MKIIISFLLTALFIWLASNYLGEYLDIDLFGGYKSALIFSLILAFFNLFLGSILKIVGFPLNFITLGLFPFIVNLIVVGVTDSFYDGIKLNGVISYIFIAIIPSISSFLSRRKS